MGPPFQGQQPIKVTESDEDVGTVTYKGAYKCKGSLGEEVATRHSRKHGETRLETSKEKGNHYPEVHWKNPWLQPNLS